MTSVVASAGGGISKFLEGEIRPSPVSWWQHSWGRGVAVRYTRWSQNDLLSHRQTCSKQVGWRQLNV